MKTRLSPQPPADFPLNGTYVGFDLPVIGRIHLWKAREPADLLDDPRHIRIFEQCNELMPYWAELWPAARALCEYLVKNADRFRAVQSAIELGAGLGAGGIVLAKLGIPTTLTDVSQDALDILRIHLRENGVGCASGSQCPGARVSQLDYFRPATLGPKQFGLVVGSDILFEKRNCRPVAETIAVLLGEGGRAYVADPFRSTADSFADCAQEAGLSVSQTTLILPSPAPNRSPGVRLFMLS